MRRDLAADLAEQNRLRALSQKNAPLTLALANRLGAVIFGLDGSRLLPDGQQRIRLECLYVGIGGSWPQREIEPELMAEICRLLAEVE